MKDKINREKFTTTLDPIVIERLGIMKAKNRARGLNDIIEELVNDKWERELNNDKDSRKKQGDK